MKACLCTMGRDGQCCQDALQYPQPIIHYYPSNPIIFHPLNTPDGQRIEDLEEKIKELQKELADLKKKDEK